MITVARTVLRHIDFNNTARSANHVVAAVLVDHMFRDHVAKDLLVPVNINLIITLNNASVTVVLSFNFKSNYSFRDHARREFLVLDKGCLQLACVFRPRPHKIITFLLVHETLTKILMMS